MLDHRLISTVTSMLVMAISAVISGAMFGQGYWAWGLVPFSLAIYLLWLAVERVKAVRNSLILLRSAVLTLPEGELPGLSTAPGVELVRLAGSLEEMNGRIRDRLSGLADDRNRLRAVFTSMRDAVIALGSTGRVALINPAAERLFEVSATDVVGLGVLQVIRHQKLALAMQQTFSTGSPVTLEFETFDVPRRHFQAEIAPVYNEKDSLSGAVAVLHDVTELRRLERVRSQFVANVSHELRTPITSIKGFLETLLDGAMEDAETTRHFLSVLSQEANRLANLVDDLLDLSRLEEDEGPLQTEDLQVAEEVAGALELVQPLAKARHIRTEMYVNDGLRVAANSEMLRQALLNLLDNAIKYTEPEGTVWVEAAMQPQESLVNISVCDSGPGIPSTHLEHLFERFFRVDKARSRAMGGTGLGLAIVKHIAERHGGKVWAESSLGKGSRFTIAFPISSASAKQAKRAPA